MRIKKSLTDLILISAEKSLDGIIRLNDFAYNPHKYLYGYPRVLNKNIISQAFKRLREKGLVDFESEENLVFKLTKKGQEQAFLFRLKHVDEKWDGIWRLVIFDIPEKKRATRDLLRSLLKQWGFVRWQNSVWASKKNCAKPLREFIHKVGITKWVMVIESNNVD